MAGQPAESWENEIIMDPMQFHFLTKSYQLTDTILSKILEIKEKDMERKAEQRAEQLANGEAR